MVLVVSFTSDRMDIIPVRSRSVAYEIYDEIMACKELLPGELYTINICNDSGLIIERVWWCD